MNNIEDFSSPEKKMKIDKEKTKRLREKWLNKLKPEKNLGTSKNVSHPPVKPTNKQSETASQNPYRNPQQAAKSPLNKEDAELLKIDLENEEKRILRQFDVDREKLSKYMQEIYNFLCKKYNTYDEAIECFESLYTEIANKMMNKEL